MQPAKTRKKVECPRVPRPARGRRGLPRHDRGLRAELRRRAVLRPALGAARLGVRHDQRRGSAQHGGHRAGDAAARAPDRPARAAAGDRGVPRADGCGVRPAREPWRRSGSSCWSTACWAASGSPGRDRWRSRSWCHAGTSSGGPRSSGGSFSASTPASSRSSPLGGLLIEQAGYRASFVVLGAIVLVLVVPLVALFAIDAPERVGQFPDGADRPASEDGADRDRRAPRSGRARSGWSRSRSASTAGRSTSRCCICRGWRATSGRAPRPAAACWRSPPPRALPRSSRPRRSPADSASAA